MDTNELELDLEPDPPEPGATWEEADAAASSDPDAPEGDADARRPGVLGSTWRGAKMGFRVASLFIGGPIAAVALLTGLAVIEFGLGTGYGFAVPIPVPGALMFFILCAVYGSIAGVVVGLIRGLARLVRPRSDRPTSSPWVDRPIRFLRRWRGAGTSGATPPSRPPWRRWTFLIGVPVQLVLVAAFGAGVYLSRDVHRRFNESADEADDDDPNWRLDDLLAHRQVVPDAENSAIVLAEALELMPENWPQGNPPARGMTPPESDASRALEQINATADNFCLDDDTADAIRRELDRYREALGIARTVSFEERGRHELELGPLVRATHLSETRGARAVARLLSADATIRVHDGDPDGALESCRAILNTARSIGDEPFLISQFVRLDIGRLSMAATRRVLGRGEPSDGALARIQALVLDELDQPLLIVAMRGERAALFERIRRVGAGEIPVSAFSETLAKIEPDGYGLGKVPPWTRLMYDNQMAVALDLMNEACAIAQRPAGERAGRWDEWEARRRRFRQGQFWPLWAGLPMLMTAGLPADSADHARHEAELGAMAILLAVERHRLKTGNWPESIGAIDREILPVPPGDPFTADDYRMEHRDGRLWIYSIGPNCQDEHGAYDPKKWGKGQLDDVGAVVWDVSLRRQPAPSRDQETGDDPASP